MSELEVKAVNPVVAEAAAGSIRVKSEAEADANVTAVDLKATIEPQDGMLVVQPLPFNKIQNEPNPDAVKAMQPEGTVGRALEEPEAKSNWLGTAGKLLIGLAGLLVFRKQIGKVLPAKVTKLFSKLGIHIKKVLGSAKLDAEGLPNMTANVGWGLLTVNSLDFKNDTWQQTGLKLLGLIGLGLGAKVAMSKTLKAKEAFWVNTVGWGSLLVAAESAGNNKPDASAQPVPNVKLAAENEELRSEVEALRAQLSNQTDHRPILESNNMPSVLASSAQ